MSNSKDELRVAMIGYGFMGKAHSNAYLQVPHFFKCTRKPVLQVLCARDGAKAAEFARSWGYRHIESDWRKAIERDDIDAVDICAPNNLHAEIAIAAARAGKMVLCEKPLAMNPDESLRMVEAVESAKVANTVWYNYRRIPAVMLARQLIEEGRLGKVFHFRAQFLQDWTISADLPQGGTGLWRLDASAAGSGVTGDLLAHCIDTAQWLNGPIMRVAARTRTFITKRMHTITGQVEPVKIDDACEFICDFSNGSLGNFESTRYARGHKAKYFFEINGENASIAWDLHDLHRLQYFDHRDESSLRGWKSIHVTDGDHPYMKRWWVPGLSIGYEHSFIHHVADFLESLDNGNPASPTFRDALATDRVCAAVLKSAASDRWESTDSFAMPGDVEGS